MSYEKLFLKLQYINFASKGRKPKKKTLKKQNCFGRFYWSHYYRRMNLVQEVWFSVLGGVLLIAGDRNYLRLVLA